MCLSQGKKIFPLPPTPTTVSSNMGLAGLARGRAVFQHKLSSRELGPSMALPPDLPTPKPTDVFRASSQGVPAGLDLGILAGESRHQPSVPSPFMLLSGLVCCWASWVPRMPVDALPLRFCRALEADRYNHVTATYFLLAERILREKQEKPSHSPSLVYNLAQQVQSRQVSFVLPWSYGAGLGFVSHVGPELSFLFQKHVQHCE